MMSMSLDYKILIPLPFFSKVCCKGKFISVIIVIICFREKTNGLVGGQERLWNHAAMERNVPNDENCLLCKAQTITMHQCRSFIIKKRIQFLDDFFWFDFNSNLH